MFLIVHNHLKTAMVVYSLPQNDPFIFTEGQVLRSRRKDISLVRTLFLFSKMINQFFSEFCCKFLSCRYLITAFCQTLCLINCLCYNQNTVKQQFFFCEFLSVPCLYSQAPPGGVNCTVNLSLSMPTSAVIKSADKVRQSKQAQTIRIHCLFLCVT